MLGGEGADARGLAHFIAAAARAGGGRSCRDAGAPLELLFDARGAASFGFAVRVGDALAQGARSLEGLAEDDDARALVDAAGAIEIEPQKSTFGVWFARDARGASIVLDV